MVTFTHEDGNTLHLSTVTDQEFYLKHIEVYFDDEPEIRPYCSGVIIRHGQDIWIVEPSNHFKGYHYAFAKGRLEKHLTPQQNALKEVWEESGLIVTIDGYVGDVLNNRFYTGVAIGGSPNKFDWETQAVHLVDVPMARSLFEHQGKPIPIQGLELFEQWLERNPQP